MDSINHFSAQIRALEKKIIEEKERVLNVRYLLFFIIEPSICEMTLSWCWTPCISNTKTASASE